MAQYSLFRSTRSFIYNTWMKCLILTFLITCCCFKCFALSSATSLQRDSFSLFGKHNLEVKLKLSFKIFTLRIFANGYLASLKLWNVVLDCWGKRQKRNKVIVSSLRNWFLAAVKDQTVEECSFLSPPKTRALHPHQAYFPSLTHFDLQLYIHTLSIFTEQALKSHMWFSWNAAVLQTWVFPVLTGVQLLRHYKTAVKWSSLSHP